MMIVQATKLMGMNGVLNYSLKQSNLVTSIVYTINLLQLTCSLYYKPMMIVNDDARIINKLDASLTDDARVVIYNHHMFRVQDTKLMSMNGVLNYSVKQSNLVTSIVHTINLLQITCGLYYKPMMIVNDNVRIINKLDASRTDDARVVIYNRHMFIVKATKLMSMTDVLN
jgi:hypothetical protein